MIKIADYQPLWALWSEYSKQKSIRDLGIQWKRVSRRMIVWTWLDVWYQSEKRRQEFPEIHMQIFLIYCVINIHSGFSLANYTYIVFYKISNGILYNFLSVSLPPVLLPSCSFFLCYHCKLCFCFREERKK